jgi:RNA polymerase sigma-70 factor, ECF subfamily
MILSPSAEDRTAFWTELVPVAPAAAPPSVPCCPPAADPCAPLVARMADGDQEAATVLHAACVAPLLRIAYAIVREHADAEEVVSDTFAQAWSDSASFDGARGTVVAWLTMIVRSRARDCVRARMRRDRARDRAEVLAAVDTTAINIGWSTGWDAARAVETRELETLLLRALRQLPEKQREVIELVFLQSVSHTTAADQLGVPLGTVKTRVRLGLRRMRVLFDDSGVTRVMC